MSTKHAAVSAADPAFQEPIAKVLSYLQALEARDMAGARVNLAENIDVTGPGGNTTDSVEGIVANSSRRYRRIGKHIARFDAMSASDGTVVVYCIGTLHGEWPDGRAFTGIRFIDRFELQGGLITRQEVWNDAAEHRMREASQAS